MSSPETVKKYSTPGKHKAKNSLTKMGKKKPLHLTLNRLPLAQISVVRRKYPSCGSGGNEKSKM